jgi:hypothetical protein
MDKLNSQLKKINDDYKVAYSMNNFETQMKLREGESVKELLNESIEQTNNLNKKYNSFLIDSSVCVNKKNTYYNNVSQIIPTNTNKYLHNNTNGNDMNGNDMNGNDMNGNDMNGKDMNGNDMNGNDMNGKDNLEDEHNILNTRMEQLQFKNIQQQHNEIYNPHNVSYNKISPFENKQHYNRKKNVDLTNTRLDEYSPMGRSINCSPIIEYQINEDFINKRNKQTNKDIANQRLEQFSPLARAVELPAKKSPLKNESTSSFLNTENTFSQNSLNKNYKRFANQPHKSHFNDVNPANENQFLENNPVGTRLL